MERKPKARGTALGKSSALKMNNTSISIDEVNDSMRTSSQQETTQSITALQNNHKAPSKGRDLYDYELYIQMEEREEEEARRRQRQERDKEIKQML